MNLVRPQAERKQITLQINVPAQLIVTTDITMIDTVLRNLLTNAIKFTRQGGTVTVSATQDAETVTVAVADTGVGIPAEKLPRLFQIDARYQCDGTAGEKGTGMGLILCKEFVEKNGGRIWAESELGAGTTFRFMLPILSHP